MLLLAIETSGRNCSVALGDGRLMLVRSDERPRQHHAAVLPMVSALLADAGVSGTGIDAIAFGRGPGSFTGLRIAVGFAQGLGFSLARPLVPVSSLAAMALGALELEPDASHACVAADAHMGEIFLGRFRRTSAGIEVSEPERLVSLADFPRTAGPGAVLAGDAWGTYPSILPPGAGPPRVLYPDALQVLRIALGTSAADRVEARDAEPYYLREANAWKTRDRPLPVH
jgi:tRNA threonylcarbamoyladenosine biosynthesis protein TsaB